MTPAPLLLVEDNEDDVFLMKRALQLAGITRPLHVAEDGQAAIDHLERHADDPAAHPALVLLDLKLPFRSGHEVLSWIRSHPRYSRLVVIVLTSSSETVDRDRAYDLRANSYVVKPGTSAALHKLAEALRLWWLEHNLPPHR